MRRPRGASHGSDCFAVQPQAEPLKPAGGRRTTDSGGEIPPSATNPRVESPSRHQHPPEPGPGITTLPEGSRSPLRSGGPKAWLGFATSSPSAPPPTVLRPGSPLPSPRSLRPRLCRKRVSGKAQPLIWSRARAGIHGATAGRPSLPPLTGPEILGRARPRRRARWATDEAFQAEVSTSIQQTLSV